MRHKSDVLRLIWYLYVMGCDMSAHDVVKLKTIPTCRLFVPNASLMLRNLKPHNDTYAPGQSAPCNSCHDLVQYLGALSRVQGHIGMSC
jgi:hypothetical protein